MSRQRFRTPCSFIKSSGAVTPSSGLILPCASAADAARVGRPTNAPMPAASTALRSISVFLSIGSLLLVKYLIDQLSDFRPKQRQRLLTFVGDTVILANLALYRLLFADQQPRLFQTMKDRVERAR